MSSSFSNNTDLSQYKSDHIKLLFLAVERALEQITDGVTIEIFREEVQKIESLKQKQKRINKLHSLLNQKLIETCMNDFKESLEDDNIDDKFQELNKIVANSSIDSESKWRPPGIVSEHTRSHFMLKKLKLKKELELYVKEKEESVKNLMDSVKSNRDKAELLEKKVLELLTHVQHSNADWEEIMKSIHTH